MAGCYFTPGGWTGYGGALRAPVGRITWAGGQTAAVWNYMDGAVQSGERVAAAVLAAGAGSAPGYPISAADGVGSARQ